MHICNVHPAEMVVLGELHLPTELNFPYPCPAKEYDERGIAFLESQMSRGIAAAGIVKCFRPWAEHFILDQGGRIVQLVRNPMEVVGFRTHKPSFYKPDMDLRFLGRKAQNKTDWFRAHVAYYAKSYMGLLRNWRHEPLIRIEDLSRSCGGNGLLFKSAMEYITQTPFPIGYVRHIQQHYLPGYHYPCETIWHDGVVVGTESTPQPYQDWRMSWGDDPFPTIYWQSWTPTEREIFAEGLGPACDRMGYNYRDRPGFADIIWPLGEKYAWSKYPLKEIPFTDDLPTREGYPFGKPGLPIYSEEKC